ETALALLKTLPTDARVHLLTHGRGGLVAEVLARVCDDRERDPDDASQLDERALALVRALRDEARQRRVSVERVARVACPARGTLLVARRLDAYLSILKWTLELARIPVAPALLGFLGD